VSQLPPTDDVLEALQYVVAPSAGAAAGVFGIALLLGWLVSRRLTFDWRAVAPPAAVLAVAAGLAAGNWALGADRPFPWSPQGKPWHWAWWAVGLMLAAEFVARLPGVAFGVGHLLRGTAAGVAAAFVVPAVLTPTAVLPEGDHKFDLFEVVKWWLPGLAGLMAVQWAVVAAVGRRSPGGAGPAAAAAACGAAAAVCLHAESIGFLNVTTFLFAALAAVAVIAFATRSDGSPAAAAATGPLVVLLFLTRHLRDSQVPLTSYLLVGLAPAALGVFLLPGVSRLNGWRLGAVLQVLAVLAPAAVGVYLAMDAAPYSFGPKEEEW
jgi:hypothetical protein